MAGAGLQVISQLSANYANAKASIANAKFLDEQADFARSSMFRSMRIAEQEYAAKYGAQASAYAGSGVDTGSGSAALVLAGTLSSAIEELYAIKQRGEIDIKLARSRAGLERTQAANLTNPLTNLSQAGGTLLNAYSATEGFGKGLPDSFSPSTGSSFFSSGFNSSYLGNIGG